MAETTTYQNALQPGSMLLEYRLESVLGAGGFGMTYLGWDTNLEKNVAIKEYLPTDLAVRALDGSVVPITSELLHDYKWGLDRFILEARTLAKFSHPHIVRVNRYFEANGTGYMVMDYEKGLSLNQILKGGVPPESRLKGILMPLLDGLQAVHATGFLHRDIKPANIFVRENGSPVLIDFGASRQAVGGATKSITSVLTPGYAPLEQYSGDGNQGPWTDIYAMAGVLYRAVASDNPPDAVSRMKADPVPGKLAELRGRVSEPLLRSVEWALRLDEHQRPQSIPEWKRALEGAAVPPPARSVGQSALQAATTVRAGAHVGSPPSISRTVVETRRMPPPPVEEPQPGVRWLGISLAILLVMAVGMGALSKHRAARERGLDESAKAEAERAAELRKESERAEAMRQRAEDEIKRLSTPPPGPITADPQAAPAPVEAPVAVVGPAPKPAAAAVEAPPIRERPGRDRDDRPGPPPEEKMDKMRGVAHEFRAADANGDGYLTPDEVRGRFPLVEREFQRVDVNGDGRISPQELVEFRRTMGEMPPPRKK